MAFVSTPSSSNKDNTANVQVNTASTNVSTASTNDSTASLSDATIYAFLANQPNGSQVVHEDLEQIHEDDLEEMDLKWQLALLSLKARKFYQRTGKKIIINGSDTAGYDKSKVECSNCHKMGHFSRECRDTSFKAMVAFNEAGFNWSFMANEEVPTNLALMAFSDSEIEKLKKEKESNQIKIDKFENASKSLDKLIGSQISNNNRKGMGYNDVPPPPIGLFAPPIIDLSSSGLKESQQPKFEGYGVNVSDCDEDECEEMVSDNVQHKSEPKPEQVKLPRKINENPRNNRTNWNEKKTQKLGVGRNFAPTAVLTKSGIVPISTTRQRSSKAAAPLSAARPINTDAPKLFLPDENQVMLKILRKDNMYNFDLKNVVPSKGLTCLIAKAINDESNKRHRRLGHINFKTMNKLVKGNLVRGLPSKIFENDHSYVACQKGKQHKASLVTDDYTKFSWVLFLAKKDKTSGILKNFITGIENQLNHKVKIIICDNGTEFKNYEMNQFCGIKGIKREFSNARTPQQNRVAKRKNKTLIEAARTILADSLLPIPFWAEAVNTACYVQNRVLVTKLHNKTPYELLIGRTPIISFMRPFGCPVTILNTLDHLGKFDGKADEGFLVGYFINSKAFRVFNSKTRKVEENLHVNFLENKQNVARSGPEWLFDIDILTNSMNYQPVSARNRTNGNAGLETNSDTGQAGKENVPDQENILLPLLHTSSNIPLNSEKDESSPKDDAGKMKEIKDSAKDSDMNDPGVAINTDSTNRLNTVSTPLNNVSSPLNTIGSPVNTISSSFTTVDPGRAKQQRNEYESLFDP
ncbi:putative ribonuclease H-like domain-containing protein, partial [Tanacetum coccineum]